MNKRKIEKVLSDFRGSISSYPFGPDVLVFKVGGKMFALVSQKELPSRVTLKCNPADAEILVSEYASVIPGYHMNKQHWITITLEGDLPDQILRDLAHGSYELVKGKLTKSQKSKLEAV